MYRYYTGRKRHTALQYENIYVSTWNTNRYIEIEHGYGWGNSVIPTYTQVGCLDADVAQSIKLPSRFELRMSFARSLARITAFFYCLLLVLLRCWVLLCFRSRCCLLLSFVWFPGCGTSNIVDRAWTFDCWHPTFVNRQALTNEWSSRVRIRICRPIHSHLLFLTL